MSGARNKENLSFLWELNPQPSAPGSDAHERTTVLLRDVWPSKWKGTGGWKPRRKGGRTCRGGGSRGVMKPEK